MNHSTAHGGENMKRVFAPLSGREREAGARQHLASPVGSVNFSHIGRVSWQILRKAPADGALMNLPCSGEGERSRARTSPPKGQQFAPANLLSDSTFGPDDQCCGRSRPRPALDGHYANGGAPPGSCTRRGSLKVRPAKRTGHFYAKQRRRLHNEGFGRGF